VEFPVFCLTDASVLIAKGDDAATAWQEKSFFIGKSTWGMG
jgi:hypothetical protein